MERPAKIFGECSICSRVRINDLLDENGVCDYCRELYAIDGVIAKGPGGARLRKKEAQKFFVTD